MDNLTHSLVGALIGQAGLKRRTGLAMPALIFGANIPDIDAGCVVWGTESLAMRRGLTHGPIAWVLLPLALAAFLWWFDRWQERRGTRPDGRLPVRFGWLYALAFIACLTHPALDWMNSYGIRLLEPFSHRWFYGDVLFIIDVWLWAAMGIGIWLSLRQEKRGGEWRMPARATIAVVLAYIGVNAGITGWHERMALLSEPYPRTAIANPVPVTFWRRNVLISGEAGDWQASRWTGTDAGYGYHDAAATVCLLPDMRTVARERLDLAAFLFWSRAPFATRGMNSGTVIQDARFFDGATAGRFAVGLPDVPCQPVFNR